MFVSTVIPTIGRHTLERSVESVLSQGLSVNEHEVIVVNDSGEPLLPADWQRDPRVSILNTQRRERGFARNAGAATASGTYLHFLDDDDWLAEGALTAFRDRIDRFTDETLPKWVFGVSQLVDRDDRPLIQLRHALSGNCLAQIMAGEWVPLQSSLYLSDTFFQVGGFDPLIPGAEDVDLVRRIALETDVIGVDATVGWIRMGTQGSSTDYEKSRRDIRGSREKVLECAPTFGRMLASSTTAYLRGCIVRVYFTSALWNLRRRRWLMAMSRLLHGLWAAVRSFWYLPTRSFWQALIAQFRNETFERGFAEAGLQFVPNTRGR